MHFAGNRDKYSYYTNEKCKLEFVTFFAMNGLHSYDSHYRQIYNFMQKFSTISQINLNCATIRTLVAKLWLTTLIAYHM